MIAVIFEVYPADGRKDEYLDIAASLRPLVEDHPGFISVERFQSLTEPNKLLSLSFFEDEAALDAWRQVVEHRIRNLQQHLVRNDRPPCARQPGMHELDDEVALRPGEIRPRDINATPPDPTIVVLPVRVVILNLKGLTQPGSDRAEKILGKLSCSVVTVRPEARNDA